MPAAIGSEVGLYYDSEREITEGDYLQTPTGRTYLIRLIRTQTRGEHVGRKHLRALVVPPESVEAGLRVHPLFWYNRG